MDTRTKEQNAQRDHSNMPSRSRRWLVQLGGELHVIESEGDLAALIAQGRVTSATLVCDFVSGLRTLGDIPDLAHLLPDQVRSDPPAPDDERSRERARLSEELAVLNRPLEDDVEYYDEVPTRRWPKRLTVAVVVAAAVIGAYSFIASRSGGWSAHAMQLESPAEQSTGDRAETFSHRRQLPAPLCLLNVADVHRR